jgi:hypothetical protein
MLKAVVIYVQGSSGNLIHRTLALDANTIPLLPVNLATTQYNYNINSNDRLELYNNWDYQNWNKTETEIGYWYKSGLSDFVELEQSNNQFINWAHPLEFFNDSKAGVWEDNSWENIIFIEWDAESLTEITHNATVKRPDLMHSHQIPAEIKMFNKLKDKYNTSCISVNWKITQELETYLTEVNNLCVRLNLTIEEELIVKLWKSWKSNTDKIFSAYYESTK